MTRIKYSLFCALILSAIFPINSAALEAGPCLTYEQQIKSASESCNLDALIKIEGSISAKNLDCPEIKKALDEAKCRYFFDCALPALNKAYLNCEYKTITKIESSLLANLRGCSNFIAIKEQVLDMKCLYFDGCVKKELSDAQKSCNLWRILEIEKAMKNDLLTDCPQYRFMMDQLMEYKCNTFTLCNLKTLPFAKSSCDLERIRQIEKELKTYMISCANYSIMEAKINQAKCDFGDACGEILKKEIDIDNCRTNKAAYIEKLIDLNEWKKCTPSQYNSMSDLADKIKCGYLDNCGSTEYKELREECDMEGLFTLEAELDSCGGESQIKLSGAIKDNKPQTITRCTKQKLGKAVQNCNFEAIEKWEGYITDKMAKNPEREELLEALTQTKLDYYKNCLAAELDAGVKNCSLEQIRRASGKIKETMRNHPKLPQMLRSADDSECLYFTNCTQRKLDSAVQNCDYKQIQALKELSRQEEIKHCPNYDRAESAIPEALKDYFSRCAQKNLYKAYNDCDWEGILAAEKMVEENLKYNRDYQRIRVLILEVKCSYFSTCLDQKLNKAIADADSAALENFQKLINQEFAACPNYPTLSRIIEEALQKIRQAK